MAAKSWSISDGGERGGRLVHDEDARLARTSALRDLDHLLLGDAELAHGARGSIAHAQVGEEASPLPRVGPAVQDAGQRAGLLAQEDVLGARQSCGTRLSSW